MTTKKLQIIGGMNADTLDGKHAEEFVAIEDFDELKTLIGDGTISEQISTIVDTKIKSHNNSSATHYDIRQEALGIKELPYLISGSIDDLHVHPSVIYGNGKYVAIDMALWNIRTSVDGINWETSATVPVMGAYLTGVYGNGKYVFISMNNELGYPIALYSEDTINWNYSKIEFTFGDNTFTDDCWNKIVFENGKFILSGGEALVVISSTDAISWTCSYEILYNGVQFGPHTVCYGNGKYVAFSQRIASNILPVFTSTDAITWTANEIDLSLLSQEVLGVLNPQPRVELNYNIIYANNTFVVIFGHKVTATSIDGVNWNFAANLPCLGDWINITYRNGIFITISNDNELNKPIIAYSTDAITWNIADNLGNPLMEPWSHSISGEDKFLITSEHGQLAYSLDGINWTYAIKSVTTLISEDKTSDLKEVLGAGDHIYVAEESVDTSVEVINADTLGGYSSSDFRHSDWVPTAEEVGARPDTWLPTIAEIGAAPAGWGYGGAMDYIVDENGTFETKLNEILAGMVNHSVKQFSFYDTKGLISKKFFGTLWRYTNQYAALEAINYDGNKAIKCMYGGVWNPWEWVNPPMAVGVEYRTTERFAGAPVYCGVISYTNAATIGGSGSNVVIEIPHPFSGLDKPIRATGRQNGVYPVPNVTSGGNTYVITRIDSNSIDLRLNGCTFDSRTWYFTIYYTK